MSLSRGEMALTLIREEAKELQEALSIGPNRPVTKPRRLSLGETIGVISPSSPAAGMCPRRFERAVSNVRNLGYEVRVGPNARRITGHTAGSPAQRASDFNGLIADSGVQAILSAIGGHNSTHLLELIDFKALVDEPKVILGYSDFTAVLWAVYAVTGMVTFLGPALMPQFGEIDGIDPFSWGSLRAAVCLSEPAGQLFPSRRVIDEAPEWDVQDNLARRSRPCPAPQTLVTGTAEGPILAGNLGTVLHLIGTPWLPSIRGALLCVEEDEVESPATIDSMFTYLRHAGVFREIHGLVVGRFASRVGLSSEILSSILKTALHGYDLPVAMDFDFGHTDPMMTMPIGVIGRLQAEAEPILSILESSVC